MLSLYYLTRKLKKYLTKHYLLKIFMSIENDKLLKEIGSRIKFERNKIQLSQIEASEIGGVSVQTESGYENGKAAPNALFLKRMHDSGMDVKFIITGKEDVAVSNNNSFSLPVVREPTGRYSADDETRIAENIFLIDIFEMLRDTLVKANVDIEAAAVKLMAGGLYDELLLEADDLPSRRRLMGLFVRALANMHLKKNKRLKT